MHSFRFLRMRSKFFTHLQMASLDTSLHTSSNDESWHISSHIFKWLALKTLSLENKHFWWSYLAFIYRNLHIQCSLLCVASHHRIWAFCILCADVWTTMYISDAGISKKNPVIQFSNNLKELWPCLGSKNPRLNSSYL